MWRKAGFLAGTETDVANHLFSLCGSCAWVQQPDLLSTSVCLSFSPALGAAYGTAKSGTGIAAMSVMRPELIMKSIIPVVMAGIIAIYGLVVAVLIANNIVEKLALHKWVQLMTYPSF